MSSNKPLCKYGPKCYRKSKEHQEKYSHDFQKADKEETITKFFKKKQQSSVESTEPTSKKVDEPLKKRMKLIDEDQSTTSTDDDVNSKCVASARISSVKSIQRVKEDVLKKYDVLFPDDFYQFAEFCKTLSANKVNNFGKIFSNLLDIELVGAFDFFFEFENLSDVAHIDWLTHWRYYYDPPEMFTVISGSQNKLLKDEFHIGYFFDDPQEGTVGMVSNSSAKDGKLCYVGPNIFAVVNNMVTEKLSEHKAEKSKCTELKNIQTKLHKYAADCDISLEVKDPKVKQREKKCVTKTFHGFGLMVPVVNDVGYRELPETNATLKKLFKRIVDAKEENERLKVFEPLDEIITFVQFANDECDYGEGIELGLDMLAFGGDIFNPQIKSILSLGYELLKREPFSNVIKAHMENRRKGSNLSNLKFS